MDHGHRTTPPRLSEDEARRLHQAGATAYHQPGARRSPALDPTVQAHASGPVGSAFAAAARAWLTGWDAAADQAATDQVTEPPNPDQRTGEPR